MSRSSAALSGLRLFAAALALTVLYGCGPSPFAPPELPSGNTAPPARPAPPVLVVADDGTASFTAADELERSWVDATPDQWLQASKEIGPEGGWLECGRFLLTLPPGALEGTGTVTMTMRDANAMIVELDITPSQLNAFKEPVLLSVNTTGTSEPSDSLGMYWFDPTAGTWVGMYCEKDLTSAKTCLDMVAVNDVTAPDLTSGNVTGVATHLSHFSKYSAGKAGW